MTLETKNRDHQIKLRQFCKTAGEKAELWIDDATGW
jgi:hypothetical protein